MTGNRESDGIISVKSVLFIFAAIIAVHALLIIAFGLDNDSSIVVNDLFLPVESLLALAVVWYGAWRTSRRDIKLGRAWYVITLSMLFWFLGETLWSVIELILKQEPFPSIADVFYLLYFPLFIVGIILIPRSRLKDINVGEYSIYSILFVAATTLLFWFLLIGPLFSERESSNLIFVFSILYPLSDLVMLNTMLVLFMLMLKRQSSGPIWCLLASVVFMAVTDSIFGIQEIKGVYTGGNIIDVGWSLSLAFTALAGVIQAFDTGDSQKRL